MWDQHKETINVEKTLSALKSDEFHDLMKFVLVKRLSNKWPYDTIKEPLKDKNKFIKYFLLNPNIFEAVYTQWSENTKINYGKTDANRNTANKTRISKRN